MGAQSHQAGEVTEPLPNPSGPAPSVSPRLPAPSDDGDALSLRGMCLGLPSAASSRHPLICPSAKPLYLLSFHTCRCQGVCSVRPGTGWERKRLLSRHQPRRKSRPSRPERPPCFSSPRSPSQRSLSSLGTPRPSTGGAVLCASCEHHRRWQGSLHYPMSIRLRVP